jgi:tetratricopeptide (TPR) repeat protein
MKKIILLVLVVFNFSTGNTQNNVRDSLKQLLKHSKEDTSRVLQLADLSFVYHESGPDTAMTLAMQALSLAERLGFEKGKAVSLNRIGNVFYVLGNYPKAMESNLQALKIYKKINYEKGVGSMIHNIGNIYSSQEDYRLALTYFLKAKTFDEKLNDYQGLSITNGNVTFVYRELKIYDSARLFAQQAYDIATRINYPRVICGALNQLGMIHFELSQYNSALEHYRLSIPFCKESNNDFQLAGVFLNMAKVFDKTNQSDSAFYYAKQSIILSKEKGFTQNLRDAARFLAFNYRKHNTDSSFFYQDIARAANDSIFSQQKQQQLQNMAFDEKLREQEMEAAVVKEKKERKLNLQYAIIFVGLISFVILFFVLGRSTIVTEKFINFFGILGLLAVFEFINLYIHPYLDKWTNHSAFLMLGILMCIGALLVPLHHKMEKWITKIMVEKNKTIRLEAARKTIAKLEGETIN